MSKGPDKVKRRQRGPKVKLCREDYEKVESMSALGLTIEMMGAILGVSKSTILLMKKNDARLTQAIENGRAKAIAKVGKVAFDMATNGKQPDMTRFYLRCRAGWTEKVGIEHSGKTEVVFKTRIGDDGILRTVSDAEETLEADELDELIK